MVNGKAPPSFHDMDRQEHREYWLGVLSKDLGRSSLLLDYKRPVSFGGHADNVTIEVDGPVFRDLKRLVGGGSPLLLLSAFMAALIASLRRYSAARRALIGTPALSEYREENAVMLALEVDDGSATFRDLLIAVRDALMAAYRHQDYPIDLLARDLGLRLSEVQCPFFDILVSLKGLHGPVPSLGQDLTVELSESQECLEVRITFNPSSFRRSTIERFAGQLSITLAEGLRDLSTPLVELTGLDEAEASRLVALGTGRRIEHPANAGVHELFEEQARQSPKAVALRSDATVLTYEELDRRANRIAHCLAQRGVGPETLVGLCMERSWELVAGLLGIHKAGGAYLALDPAYPRERLDFMVEDAKPRVLLTQARLRSLFEESELDILFLDDDWDAVGAFPESRPSSGVVDRNLAYCMYTSGSTGRPKGVLIEHRSLLNRILFHQATYPLSEADRVIHKTSLCFDGSVWEIYIALISGAELIVASPDAHKNLDAYIDTVSTHGVTVTEIVTTLLEHLLEHERFGECDSLRLVFCIGEPLPVGLAERFLELSRARLVHAYGQTEATIDATSGFYQQERHPRLAPLGKPLDNMEVHVLDARQRLIPQGAPGEACIGGPQLARGYLNAPRLTAERFVPNPFAKGGDGARLYRSGDLARYQGDGQVEFLGRTDDQVKLRGQRIELGEIENVLAEQDGVRQCHVIAREVTKGERRLVAYVVGKAGLTASLLRERLEARLTEAMIPGIFVFLKSMPLLSNGKVDRAALPPPTSDRPAELASDFVAPKSAIEKRLTAIWQEVLHIDRIGVEDNFFDLGGDSILTLLVASQAARAGLSVSPRQIYDHQTIQAIAQAVGSTRGPSVAREPAVGPVPLTPIQQRFFKGEPPDPNHYNQAFLFRVEPLDPHALEKALEVAVAHHDALRHRFSFSSLGVEQRGFAVHDVEPPLLEIEDLSTLTVDEAERTMEQKAASTQRRLNISKGPLLRAVLFKLPAGSEDSLADRLLLVIHHLVVDGVSWRILLEDLETVYEQCRESETSALPPKTTPFKEWAERLDELARSPELARQVDYWTRSAGEATSIPLDFPADRGNNSNDSRAELKLGLDDESTKELVKFVREMPGVRVLDVLLAALVRCLGAWTGNDSVLFDLESHGREELFDGVDLSRTVGWFTSVFPVRLRLDKSADPKGQVRAIRRQLQEVPEGGIGFGLLRHLGRPVTRQEMASLPQAEILFNYLGRLDQLVLPESMFQLAPENTGDEETRQGMRSHMLELSSLLVGDRLRLQWRYSTNLHRPETIRRLATHYFDEVRQIVRRSVESGDRKPSPEDYPQAGVGQADLDKVLARAKARRRMK